MRALRVFVATSVGDLPVGVMRPHRDDPAWPWVERYVLEPMCQEDHADLPVVRVVKLLDGGFSLIGDITPGEEEGIRTHVERRKKEYRHELGRNIVEFMKK